MLLNKNSKVVGFEYIIGKNGRKDLFLTQTPQAFNLKEIYNLHKIIVKNIEMMIFHYIMRFK